MRKVLVTGSSGFIGRWVVQVLQREGLEVIGLDVKPATDGSEAHIVCDIRNRGQLIREILDASPDAIVHLAARIDLLEKHEISGYSTNNEGIRNLVAAVRATTACRRVIYTSSQLVCRPGYVPRNDTDYCPHTVYGQSKVLTEQIVREEAGAAGEWCLTRPTTVWGPGMSPHYQTMLRLIARGRYFHCGSSPLLKSYSYAENIAWQYYRLLMAPTAAVHGKTFYLCDYEPLSLRHYADTIAKEISARSIPTVPLTLARLLARIGDCLNAAGWATFPFNSFRLDNILTEYVFDTTLTKAVCGPLPVSYPEGVRRTARWFKDEVLRHG